VVPSLAKLSSPLSRSACDSIQSCLGLKLDRMATEIAAIAADPAVLAIPANMLSELAIVGGTDFFSATLKSLIVILVTEIGDKTFFIAAVCILLLC
jgi:hypothetical protein